MPACRHCGEENPERARFCLACGQALAHLCPACGEENPDRARFCLACGTALIAPAAPASREVRKTVTIVFCDVAGSTSLGESLDPESLRNVMGRYFGAMQTALERHGGTVEKFIGDAVMAVFGIPVVREDDALRAVRAAGEMRDARTRLNEELQRTYGVTIDARIGVNTGQVVAGDSSEGQRFATGDTVNVAARLEQAATGGEILIGEETYRLVREAVLVEPVEPLELKGKAARVPAYRLLEVRGGVEGVGRRSDAPHVGREREVRRLGEIFGRVRSDPACWLVTVLGAAGLGKSRLVEEFAAGLDDVRLLGGRCLPYGEGITFWPVAEIVRAAAGVAETDSTEEAVAKIGELAPDEISRDRVAAAIGLGESSGSVEETFWGVRRLLESLAEQQPLVLGFDDIHWAEPTLLDLIEYLSGWIRDLPVLIVCQARPELLEGRPGWGAASNAAVVSLEPLTTDQSGELIEALLRDTSLTKQTRARILEVAGGNPLFVEQMLAMLDEDGDEIAIPPTIQALLAARLDRLEPAERAVIERASIEGAVFHRGAVTELGAGDALPQLMTLVRRELIRPARATFAGEDAFSFHHLLIRDAAYDSMPKQLRSDLHERYAGWLERTAGDRVREHEEILGYHLEQAHRLRTELGPTDERARELAAQAGSWLLAASRRAEERGDLGAVVNLMGRAAKLVGDRDRLALLPDLGAALVVHGQLVEARTVLDEATASATRLGDGAIHGHAELELVTLDLQAGNERELDEVQELIGRLVARFTEDGDELGLLRAYRALAGVHWVRAHFGEVELALDKAVEYALRVGRRGVGVDSLAWLAMATRFGPTPAADGLRRCDEILVLAEGDRNVESTVLIARGGLEAMRGQLDDARSHLEQGRAILHELGLKLHHAAALQSVGLVELIGGDAATAERHLREGYDRLSAMQESGFLSTIAAYLGRAVYEQGRLEEADALAAEAARIASPDDLVTQVVSRGLRARVLARRGDIDSAAGAARSAIELAESTDCLELIADAHAALADVLTAGADHHGAATELALAVEAFERKGADALAARLRERLETAARVGTG